MSSSNNKTPWTFLTNHSHVLLCLVDDPEMRMRDIAIKVGITERAVQRIISDLADDGYIKRIKEGRCNHYKINTEKHLRHEIEKDNTLEELINLILPSQ